MGDLFLKPNNLVEVSIAKNRAVVRFISPQTRNPISSTVLGYLENIVAECESICDIDDVVFTGTGGIFASGADLREIATLTPQTARDFAARGQALMRRIEKLPMTTIAAVNGYCYGGGLDLALACKRRTASPKAEFCHPGSGLGIITGWGGTQRLPRLVGTASASEMFFTARPIAADRALQIGLIDAINDDAVGEFRDI